MKVAILGSGGRLGATLARAYGEKFSVIGFTHAGLDIASREQLFSKLDPLDFEVLVNCAAQTNVDRCESHPEEAMRLNADAVRDIAEICARKNARLIHLSTDYVFDGKKKSPYSETDEPSPLSVYGESKRRGEIAALEASGKNLVVRVSWVFGPDRPSFIDMILRRALESEQVAAIADKWSSPLFTLDAADLLQPFVAGEILEGGLLHLCNAGACSWREYGQHAIDIAIDAGLPIKGKTVGALALAEMKNFLAKRPVYTVLATEKLARLTGRAPRPWQDAVEDYVRNYFAKTV